MDDDVATSRYREDEEALGVGLHRGEEETRRSCEAAYHSKESYTNLDEVATTIVLEPNEEVVAATSSQPVE